MTSREILDWNVNPGNSFTAYGQFENGLLNGAAILYVEGENVTTISNFLNGVRSGLGYSYGFSTALEPEKLIEKPRFYVGEYQRG